MQEYVGQPIWTPLIPATTPEEKMESFGSNTPLGRAGQPAELAPACVFFASPESSAAAVVEPVETTPGNLR